MDTPADIDLLRRQVYQASTAYHQTRAAYWTARNQGQLPEQLHQLTVESMTAGADLDLALTALLDQLACQPASAEIEHEVRLTMRMQEALHRILEIDGEI